MGFWAWNRCERIVGNSSGYLTVVSGCERVASHTRLGMFPALDRLDVLNGSSREEPADDTAPAGAALLQAPRRSLGWAGSVPATRH